MTITVGSLFAGIGGLDLGLERTGGFKTVWQVEIDPFARRVLEKHWPDVRRHDDVRTFPPDPTEDWRCDLICGGFPCQDISHAGKREGINGASSGLWGEFSRIIRMVRPRLVLVENVPALFVRGMGRVLGDLAEIGYDAEWDCISAGYLGAWHRRDRVFILAYPASERQAKQMRLESKDHQWAGSARVGGVIFNQSFHDGADELLDGWAYGGFWSPESPFQRVAHGVPRGVDRLRGIGNAVVPQVAEWIGNRILDFVRNDRG